MSFLKEAEKLFHKAEKEIGQKFSPNEFASEAQRLLKQSNIHEKFNSDSVHELLSHRHYPGHYYSQKQFGDVALTLFKNDKYFLDIYFWRHRDTDIHAHHFTGAFKMLAGRQFQLECRFKENEKIYNFLYSGKVQIKNYQEIKTGDTQLIRLNEDFIHQTHHDNKLMTANLCLRTHAFPDEQLWGYFLHGYKFLNLSNPDERQRKLSLIHGMPKRDQLDYLTSFFATQDLHTLVTLAIGETWTSQIIDKPLRALIIRYLEKKRPEIWAKTSHLIKGIPLHQKKHHKLRFFMYDNR